MIFWLSESKMNTGKPPHVKETLTQRQDTHKTGKGMPAKTPHDGRGKVGQEPTPDDAADEASLALPHERDQSTDMTADKPDPAMRQAGLDLKRGLQDTSKSPEMNRAYDKLK